MMAKERRALKAAEEAIAEGREVLAELERLVLKIRNARCTDLGETVEIGTDPAETTDTEDDPMAQALALRDRFRAVTAPQLKRLRERVASMQSTAWGPLGAPGAVLAASESARGPVVRGNARGVARAAIAELERERLKSGTKE